MCAKINEYNHPAQSTGRKPAAFFFACLDTIQTLFKTHCNFSMKSVDKFLISEYYAFTISETCGEA